MQPALLDAVIRHRRERLLHFAFQRIFKLGERTPFLQFLVFVIHHAKRDFQMLGHLIPMPVFPVDRDAGHPAQFTLQSVQQRQLQRRYAT